MLYRDKHGWPVEYVLYKSWIFPFRYMNKFLRILIHTNIIRTWKQRNDDYWHCDNCSAIAFEEQEVMCWSCGKGEMIHRTGTNRSMEALNRLRRSIVAARKQ